MFQTDENTGKKETVPGFYNQVHTDFAPLASHSPKQRCASNVVPKLSTLRSYECHAQCCWQSKATARQSVLNTHTHTHTHTHTQKKKKKKKQRKRFSSSWQKVEADTFPRASWQRKPLFVSFFFCYSFEEESLPFPFLQLHFPFFAFLISKWAELQLGQNCFRDRREGWRREETDGDGDGARGEVNKKEELKECGWSGGGGGGGGGN